MARMNDVLDSFIRIGVLLFAIAVLIKGTALSRAFSLGQSGSVRLPSSELDLVQCSLGNNPRTHTTMIRALSLRLSFFTRVLSHFLLRTNSQSES